VHLLEFLQNRDQRAAAAPEAPDEPADVVLQSLLLPC
jgi:hypothetical protein